MFSSTSPMISPIDRELGDCEISVSEINQNDLDRLEREGYTFHQSKYQPNELTISSRLAFGKSELERLESQNFPTVNLGNPPNAGLLSPPTSTAKSAQKSKPIENEELSLVSRLRMECQQLRETNQKLVEVIEENHKALASTKRQVQESNELRVKNSQLAAKIDQLEQFSEPNAYLNSPLADYSAKKNLQMLEQAKNVIQQEWEAKFTEYRQMCQEEFAKKEAALIQEAENGHSRLKLSYETEICKLKYQIEQSEARIVDLEKSLTASRRETQEIRDKLAKEAEDRVSQMTLANQKSIDSLISRLTQEKQTEITELRQKHRKEVASLVEKMKEQYSKALLSQKQQSKEEENAQIQLLKREIEKMRLELAEKESLFVNALLPTDSSAKKDESCRLQKRNQQLEAEITEIRTVLVEQKQKILQKVKRKFKEHLLYVKQTFLLEKQRLEMEFERRMREKVEYLGTKYKMKLLQIRNARPNREKNV